jgi:hypothetical protein
MNWAAQAQSNRANDHELKPHAARGYDIS